MADHFLVKAYYHIYHWREQGWFFCKLGHEIENQAWLHGLVPSRIVLEFFKLEKGKGYYLVNLRDKKYYYCGINLASIWQKLREVNGFCHNSVVWQSSKASFKPDVIGEEFINLNPEHQQIYIFYYNGKVFQPFDTQQFAITATDLGITWKELEQLFLDLNGGRQGFYLYKAKKVSYFNTVKEIRHFLANQESNMLSGY